MEYQTETIHQYYCHCQIVDKKMYHSAVFQSIGKSGLEKLQQLEKFYSLRYRLRSFGCLNIVHDSNHRLQLHVVNFNLKKYIFFSNIELRVTERQIISFLVFSFILFMRNFFLQILMAISN
jgi:hypothetical protein